MRRASPSTSATAVVTAEVVVLSLAVAAFDQVSTASPGDRLGGIAMLVPGLGAAAGAVLAPR